MIFFFFSLADISDLCGYDYKIFNKDFNEISEFLCSIDGVYCRKSLTGCYLWYVDTQNSKHIIDMIKEQKPPKERAPRMNAPPDNNIYMENARRYGKSNLMQKKFYNSTNSCYFKDNHQYKLKLVDCFGVFFFFLILI